VLEAVVQKQGQSVEGNHVSLFYNLSNRLTQLGGTKNSLLVLASSAEYPFQIRDAKSFEGIWISRGMGSISPRSRGSYVNLESEC
jgi:hypothetical protein